MSWGIDRDEEVVEGEDVEIASDDYSVVSDDYVPATEEWVKYPPLGYPIFSELIKSFVPLREGRVRGRGFLVLEGRVTYLTPVPGVKGAGVEVVIPQSMLREFLRRSGYSAPYVEVSGVIRYKVIGAKRVPVLEVRDADVVTPPRVNTYMDFGEYLNVVTDGVEVRSSLRELYALHPISSPGLPIPKAPLPPGLHASVVGRYSSVVEWVISQYHPSRVTKYFRLVKASLSRFRKSRRSVRGVREVAEVDSIVKGSDLAEFIRASPDLDFLILIDDCPKSKDSARDLLSIRRSYDVTNYLLTTRLASPYPLITDDVLDLINTYALALARAVSRANIPRYLVGKGRFLDLTYLGRPATVLRLAQSMVRAGLKDNLSEALRAAMDSLLGVIKEIEEGVTTGELMKKHTEILGDEALLLKIIEDIEASKGCATIADIKEELRIRVKDPSLERHLEIVLDALARKGYLMYLMKPQGKCYKVVP